LGPAPLLQQLRRTGVASRLRTDAEKARLKKLVSLVDFFMPGGSNCYRRALLEIAVDRDAATDLLRLGLRAHGGPQSGHAWLGSAADGSAARYDAEFSL
jgi:hypothetical protein